MNKALTIVAVMTALAPMTTGAAFASDLPAAQPAAPAAPPASDAYLLNLLYTGEAWDNTMGGLRTGAAYMYNFDAQLQVDTGKAFGWTGGMFVADGWFANQMSFGNKFIGAVDQQSPIDTASGMATVRLYQLFYDQSLGATDLRFGIYDLETEFSALKPMSLFMSKDLTWNTALDQSGTMPLNGTVGPGNYPYTPLAFRVRQDFSKQFSIQIVVADGAADNPNNLANTAVMFNPRWGATLIGEADYTPDKYTKAMAGVWDQTGLLPEFGQLTAGGAQKMEWNETGGYVGGNARIFSPEPKRGLDVFALAGFSTPETTNVTASLNGGLVYTGLFDFRPADKAGVSFNVNEAPTGWRQYMADNGMPNVASEESFEVTYRAKINEYLTIQPDIQYIVNPGYQTNLKNPLALGFHFEIGKILEW